MKHTNAVGKRFLWVKIRMGVVASVFILGFLAVVGRVYYLQTVEAEALTERGRPLSRDVTMQARRGNILDRNGVELAVSVEVPSIFAHPRQIENPEREARRLMPHLGQSYETLVARLSQDSGFVWLERQGRPASGAAIRELDIPGIGITNEFKRYYPLRERAGQLLGFVGVDGKGLEGIEQMLNSELAGGTYQLTVSRDAQSRPMLTNDAPRFQDFEGQSGRLTIDERIQRVAEESLRAQVEKHSAKGGHAVVMDIHTGEILAMANTPMFDPNRFGEFTSDDWRLRGVTDTFEPGSVFKPFVLAGALQEGTVGLDTKFDVENGRMRIGKYTIRDTARREVLTLAQVMQISSNIGTYKIAQTMGREKTYEYIRAFGFGSRSGVGLRGEQPGLVWPPDRWAEISFANVSFGQGLTTTPLQLAAATAAIANGGMLLQPRVIGSVVDREGNVIRETSPTLVRRVVSPEVAKQVAWSMGLVTIPGGTGTAAAIEHFTVAGKTGTAQKVNSETRRYDPTMWVAGFVGFVPAERPEVAIVVIIDEPYKMHYGGVVSGPAFAAIATEAMAIRGVLPVPPEERFRFGEEDDAPLAANTDKEEVRPKNLVMVPAMRVLESYGEDDDEGAPTVPDFRQMTLRQAMQRAQQLGALPTIEGWGRVIAQEPPPGTPVTQQLALSLVLSPVTSEALISDEPSTGAMQ